MLEFGIVTGAVGILNTAGRTALLVVDLVQTPAEVEAATAEIQACHKKLGELMELRKQHAALLAESPADEAVIEATIATAWRDLTGAKRVLEPNRIIKGQAASSTTSVGGSGTQREKRKLALGRRIRWKFVGRGGYRAHEQAIRRNHTEVRDQINRLEQIVRLGPLEALARRTKDEEQRRQVEMERARDERDIKGLGYLEPVVVVQEVMQSVEAEDAVSRGSSFSFSERGDDVLDVAALRPGDVSTGSSRVSSGSTLQSLVLPSPLPESADNRSSGLITGLMADLLALGADD